MFLDIDIVKDTNSEIVIRGGNTERFVPLSLVMLLIFAEFFYIDLFTLLITLLVILWTVNAWISRLRLEFNRPSGFVSVTEKGFRIKTYQIPNSEVKRSVTESFDEWAIGEHYASRQKGYKVRIPRGKGKSLTIRTGNDPELSRYFVRRLEENTQ